MSALVGLFHSIPWWVWSALGFLLHAAKWLFILWILFLAVMKLQDVEKSGVLATLDPRVQKLARAVLIVGILYNAFVRVFLSWMIFWELPRWGEWAVSAQVKRLCNEGSGWRQERAEWWSDNMLGPFDATGRHNKEV